MSSKWPSLLLSSKDPRRIGYLLQHMYGVDVSLYMKGVVHVTALCEVEGSWHTLDVTLPSAPSFPLDHFILNACRAKASSIVKGMATVGRERGSIPGLQGDMASALLEWGRGEGSQQPWQVDVLTRGLSASLPSWSDPFWQLRGNVHHQVHVSSPEGLHRLLASRPPPHVSLHLIPPPPPCDKNDPSYHARYLMRCLPRPLLIEAGHTFTSPIYAHPTLPPSIDSLALSVYTPSNPSIRDKVLPSPFQRDRLPLSFSHHFCSGEVFQDLHGSWQFHFYTNYS